MIQKIIPHRIYLLHIIFFIVAIISLSLRIQAYAKINCISCLQTKRVLLYEQTKQVYGVYSFSIEGMNARCLKKDTVCSQNINKLRVGDKLIVQGKIDIISRPFGEETYFLVNNIEQVDKSLWSGIVFYLHNFQQTIVASFEAILDSPQAELLNGILLGFEQHLPNELYQALLCTGTIHVVAASGYNVTIVANIILGVLLLLFDRKLALFISMLAIIAYLLIAGMSASVVRAGIMGILSLGSQIFGREYLPRIGLLFTILLMLFLEPWLVRSISFQLSVVSTMGMLWGLHPTKSLLEKILSLIISGDSRNQLRKLLSLTVSSLVPTLTAILATTPIILLHFQSFSLMALMANMAILWLVEPIMILGLLFIPWLLLDIQASLAGILLHPLLTIFVNVISWFNQFNWLFIKFEQINWFIAVGWWLLLCAWWLGNNSPLNQSKNLSIYA